LKLLIDTHLLLWAAGDADNLSDEARALKGAPDNDLFFSAASIWEIAIKRGLGREDFQVEPRVLRRGLLDNGYNELAIVSEHGSPSTFCLRFMKTHLTVFWLPKPWSRASSC
jgi:PIN domain nuclease of toxin-antitoxin system